MTAEGYEEAGKLAYAARRGTTSNVLNLQRTILKPRNTSRNTTTNLAADPHLRFPVEAGRSYLVRAKLFVSLANATGDFKWSFTAPGTTPFTIGYSKYILSAAPTAQVVDAFNSLPAGTVLSSAASYAAVEIEFTMYSIDAAGEVILTWSQNTSDAGATIVFAGSYIEVVEFDYG